MTDWWEPAIRPGRAIGVKGVSPTDIATLITNTSNDCPIVISYPVRVSVSPQHIVTDVLAELERIVVHLFPDWLPGATQGAVLGAEHSRLDIEAAAILARELCSETDIYRPVVVELAKSAAGRRTPRLSAPNEVSIGALSRLLRISFEREDVVLVFQTANGNEANTDHAAEWLARHGQLTAWIIVTDDGPRDVLARRPLVELRPNIRPSDPSGPGTPAVQPPPNLPAETDDAIVMISRREGLPAPNSAAEQRLERALAQCDWASGRRWNRMVAGLNALAPTVIADLSWLDARVIVEVDGPDHRTPAKYAADRRRDNLLQRHGYVVFRFTNERVLADTEHITDELRDVITWRRGQTDSNVSSY